VATPCETFSLTIPAQVSSAGVASVYLEAVAGQFGFNADQSRQLAQSLLVILQDVISQAFGPGENQDVQISCRRLPIGLQVTIGEKGLPLSERELASLAVDPQACPLVRLEDHLSCVREVWDEASFHNLGRAGGQVDLVKYFTGQAESLQQVCPVAPLTEPSGRPATEPETFTVRPFSPADAHELIRLLYRTYGYSYPFEHLYYPERLIALNADGSLLSLVAISSQAELVGHVALFFSKENGALAELGAAVVHPDFRGHGCLRQLTEYALAEGRRRQLQALYGRPVTNHIYSQKVSEDLGFKPCGLLVGFGPAFLSFKKIHEDLSQRESMILIYRSLRPMPPVKIFPPPRHRDVILKIYAGLGLTPEAADSSATSPSPDDPPGNLDISMFPAGGIALIKMKAIGPDSLHQLRQNLKHLCLGRFEVINLHLDLCRPAVAQLVTQCESLGFFFAGLLPGLNNTQTLILQYLNNVPLDYDKIQLHSPATREILAYVQEADHKRI
jgi:RimJ/RimL family protein N-acetyltransferase